MPFQIIRNDITKVQADIIVNTANPLPIIGNGTDCAIYKAAGVNKLLAERVKIGSIERGEIAVTPAFDLEAKYIIHTVGPIWEDGTKGEFEILRSCYKKSLAEAAKLGVGSIAFPLIATGVYGFPKDKALQIAMNEISSFLMQEDIEMLVSLVVFDDRAFRLSKSLFYQVEEFIDDNAVIEAHRREHGLTEEELLDNRCRRRREQEERSYYESLFVKSDKVCCIEPSGAVFDEHTFDKDLYMNDGKSRLIFRNHLVELLIDKDIDNVDAYKRSNITKGAFSKIMSGDTRIPKKSSVLGMCIGLKLDLEEAKELLASADMAFNPYDNRDKLVIQCIQNGQYDVNEVNAMLYLCQQPLLGNC